MSRTRGALATAAALALAGCGGGDAANETAGNAGGSVAEVRTQPKAEARSDVVTVDTASDLPLPTGGTPMAERVAVVGLLNKRNGETRELTLKPGQAQRVGDVIVRLRACERTASWESEQLTGAFVQLDVRQPDNKWRRVFSGWIYKERPALNVVQHPIYDVWPKSCTMSWPEGGDAVTRSPDEGRAASRRSNAPKSADRPATESGSEPSGAPSAEASNAT